MWNRGRAAHEAAEAAAAVPAWRSWVSRGERLGSALVDLVFPEDCAGCGRAGTVCCAECRSVFDTPELVARDTSTHALTRYRGTARALVVAHKEHRRRGLTRPLGDALAAAVPHLPTARPGPDGTWWLVPVPSRPSAARRRGGSHLLALARRCAATLHADGHSVAVAPALRLAAGARDAVGLDRTQRAANLAGRLRVREDACPPRGTPVVLLDDVVTTGATLSAARAALVGAGVPVGAALTLTAA